MQNYEVLIPAYNAKSTLAELLPELFKLSFPPAKITIVDDGSTDDTQFFLKRFDVKVLKNTKNLGKGASLRRGYDEFLKRNEHDFLLCMDADLQHPVLSISDFIKYAEQNESKIFIGNRSKRPGQMPFFRILSNYCTSKLLSWLTRQKILDSQCGFRMIHKSVLTQVELKETGFQLESEFIIQAAKKDFKITFVPIPTIYNGENSNISHMNDTFRFIRLFIRELFKW